MSQCLKQSSILKNSADFVLSAGLITQIGLKCFLLVD